MSSEDEGEDSSILTGEQKELERGDKAVLCEP